MSETVLLKGITWNHTRGYCPKVATAQRYQELHPEVEIRWEKRSLQAFADQSIEDLARAYDLLVIDHPSIGEAASHGIFRALDGLVPEAALKDSATASVGASHASYQVDGRQWALPVDAATPVASWRPDLLRRLDAEVPRTWNDLLALARRGAVAVPAIPIDSLMNLCMLWLDEGDVPGTGTDTFGRRDAGLAALEALKELVSACDAACLVRNPIQTYEAMTQGDFDRLPAVRLRLLQLRPPRLRPQRPAVRRPGHAQRAAALDARRGGHGDFGAHGAPRDRGRLPGLDHERRGPGRSLHPGRRAARASHGLARGRAQPHRRQLLRRHARDAGRSLGAPALSGLHRIPRMPPAWRYTPG